MKIKVYKIFSIRKGKNPLTDLDFSLLPYIDISLSFEEAYYHDYRHQVQLRMGFLVFHLLITFRLKYEYKSIRR